MEMRTETMYLTNLLVDLENQSQNVLTQIDLEKANQETCEFILALIQKPPFSFKLDVEAFPEAETIILSNLEDDHSRFKLHNKMAFRGRLSSLQITVLNILLEENRKLQEQLKLIP